MEEVRLFYSFIIDSMSSILTAMVSGDLGLIGSFVIFIFLLRKAAKAFNKMKG